MRFFAIGLGVLTLWMTGVTASAEPVALVAGPMVGHVTDNSARLWMQFPIAGEVSITVFDSQQNRPVSGVKVGLESPSPFVCDVPLNNLEPDHTYRVEVKFENAPVALPAPDLVIRTAPAPGETAALSVAFGSDIAVVSAPAQAARAGAPARQVSLPIFKPIADLKPRAFFFLGNTGYLPAKLDQFPTTRRLAFRAICDLHERVRQEPALQELFRTTPCYSIYNDRDFGTLDADSSFVFAPESLVAFQRYWPNPDWGTPDAPGCYSNFTYGDVDFFLLDCRAFRTPATAGAGATQPAPAALFGPAQLEWLEKNLQQSRATFKVLAAPCALFNEDGDSWISFPTEQKAFLAWLHANRINGLLALAGNRPAGEILHADPRQTGLGYPVFTAGTSTLTDLPNQNETAAQTAHPAAGNPESVGEPVLQNNFGTLDFGGDAQHRFVTLRIRDESGKIRIEQTAFATQLRWN